MQFVAEHIREIISQSGMSYRELSQETGIPYSTIQRYATGKTAKIPLQAVQLIIGVIHRRMYRKKGSKSFPLCQNIRDRRLEMNMSQETLANLTGYTDRSSISRIEKGEIDIPQSKISQFAEALGLTPEMLIGWKSNKVQSQYMLTTGERIQKRRKELGMSTSTMASLLGKHRATIYRYESSEIENMPITILKPIADVLKTTPEYLMGWEENEALPPYQPGSELTARIAIRIDKDELFSKAIEILELMDQNKLAAFIALFDKQ